MHKGTGTAGLSRGDLKVCRRRTHSVMAWTCGSNGRLWMSERDTHAERDRGRDRGRDRRREQIELCIPWAAGCLSFGSRIAFTRRGPRPIVLTRSSRSSPIAGCRDTAAARSAGTRNLRRCVTDRPAQAMPAAPGDLARHAFVLSGPAAKILSPVRAGFWPSGALDASVEPGEIYF